MTRADTGALVVDSTGRVTPVFRIENRGATARTGRIALALPAQWRSLAADTSVSVAPGTAELAFVPVWVPPSAVAGAATVGIAVAVEGFATPSRDSAVVTVPVRRRLTALPQPPPRFIAAGERYTVGFILHNAGNAPIILRLDVSGSNGIGARLLDSAIVGIAPGAERVVRAEVATSARLTSEVRHRVVLRAVPDGSPIGAATAATLVEIVPRRQGAVSRFRQLPAELVLRGGDEPNSYSAELRGGGLLGSGSKTRLDFLLRGPNPSGSFLGQQDEFRVGIMAPHLRATLGDVLSFGSILSETGRATFGVTAAAGSGPFQAEVYSRRDRRAYEFTKETQHGGTADAWLAPHLRLGGSAFTRSGVDAATGWTTRGLLNDLLGTTIEAEYARTSAASGAGSAYTTSITGLFPRLSYDLRRESADAGFANYWRGSTSTYASAYLRPVGRLLTLNARFNDRQARKLALLPFSVDRHQAGIEGGVSMGRFVGVTARRGRETGLTFAPAPERDSRSASVFTGVPIGRVWLRAEAEQGHSVYPAPSFERAPFTRVGFYVSGNAGGQGFSANVQKLNGTAPFTVSAQDRLSGNATLSLRLGPITRLNVEVNTLQYAAPTPATFTTVDVGIGRQLPLGHRVRLRSRALAYSPAVATRKSMQNLEYGIPIGVPFAFAEDNGVVDVDMVDDAAGRPAANVLLRLGSEARITDANGHARFTGLGAGQYYLEPDRGSMASGRVVMPATPLSLTLRAGERRRVQLHLVGSSRVEGRVNLQEWRRPRIDGPDTLVDLGPVANVVIGMANGDTVRSPVDAAGRFVFTDLHPGRWTMFVIAADLPPQHHFDRERIPLDLAPGVPQVIDLKVVPDRREVRFQPTVEVVPVVVLPDSAPARAPVAARHSYTVAGARETLMHIAGVMYGDGGLWPKIWLANAAILPTPESVRVGQRLGVPDSAPLTPAELAARDRYLARARPARFYTVSRGDGLMSIARAVYDDASLWPKIWYANRDLLATPDRLRAGQRLRIPEKAPLTRAEISLRDSYGRRPP